MRNMTGVRVTISCQKKQFVCSYELRHRRHNRELINKTSRLADSDFIIHIWFMYRFYLFQYVTLHSVEV